MIHETAIVSDKADIDSSVSVGPYCIIDENVTIGPNTILESHVVIKKNVVIGNGNHFYQFSSIGEQPQDLKFKGEDSLLIIGNNNIFREYCTLNRGTKEGINKTQIGSNNLFMAYTHVAHDCVIKDHCIFSNAASLAGHVIVGDYVSLGGFTLVHQFCNIGDYSFIGMNTSINMDIPAFVKVAADPARIIGLNSVGMSRNDISSESISLIKKAYKLVYRKGLKIDEAIKKSKELNKDQNDSFLDIFIKSLEISERGILR